MPTPRTYKHLTPEDRAYIMISVQQGRSLRAIAQGLRRSPSTISREVRRLPQRFQAGEATLRTMPAQQPTCPRPAARHTAISVRA